MIAHNVRLDPGCVVVARWAIAGSTEIRRANVRVAQVDIAGHLTIGPGLRLAARTAVPRDLLARGTCRAAPAVPIREWRQWRRSPARAGEGW